MKRSCFVICAVIILCVLCGGCDSWMGGEYISVTPHEEQPKAYANKVIEVNSYTQLRNAVANLVRIGADDGIISISAFNKGTIHFYVDTAISNVIENTAFGAYAVEKITYEIGTNRGTSVVACKIHYRSGYQPHSKIKRIENTADMNASIIEALDSFDRSVLLHTEQYEKLDMEEVVAAYASEYPDRLVEIPTVTVNVYPEKGAERIVEILFDYETDQIVLQQMRAKVEEHFGIAQASIEGIDDPSSIYEQLFTHLAERYSYNTTITSTPAYSFFEKNIGNEKTFADIYTRICTRIGLGCKTVTGTKNGRDYVWNAVQIRGKFYYVDLHQCFIEQKFSLLTDRTLDAYNPDLGYRL